ncbi:MAG: hypothetical protein ACI4JY_00110 [Oscillospiraceae bacterium]
MTKRNRNHIVKIPRPETLRELFSALDKTLTLIKTENCCGIRWLELGGDYLLTAEFFDPHKCYYRERFTAPELYLYGAFTPEKTAVYSVGAFLRQIIFECPAGSSDNFMGKLWDFSETRFAREIDADSAEKLSALLGRSFTISRAYRLSIEELDENIRLFPH